MKLSLLMIIKEATNMDQDLEQHEDLEEQAEENIKRSRTALRENWDKNVTKKLRIQDFRKG